MGFVIRSTPPAVGNYQTLINKALREFIGTRTGAFGKNNPARHSRELRKKGAV